MPTHLGQEIYPSKQFLERIDEVIYSGELDDAEKAAALKDAFKLYEERVDRMANTNY